MAVNPTEGLAFTNLEKVKKESNPATSETARKSLSDNFDQFLLLLTTQLQNQDPTDPLDTNEFTSQLVQFSSVEQAVKTNTNLEKMLSLLQTSQLDTAVGYIGKAVEAKGNKGVLLGGQAEFAYDLPAGSTDVTVSLTDSNNRVVFSGPGSQKTGKNVIIWDGVNSFTNKDEPDGEYTLSVKAKDSKGDEIKNVTTYSSGRVTSVDMQNGTIQLNIGTLKVKLDQVISIREAAPYLPAQTTANNTTNNNG
jgi:flagellar basal-body rod modification protein FlgD